mmetsp:Transcript_15879/g.43162  ORF Transcript_15879/g.43162 Transcript_15879/m.43162 type:complete len:150 (-) Transcript_15879:283-732(-)
MYIYIGTYFCMHLKTPVLCTAPLPEHPASYRACSLALLTTKIAAMLQPQWRPNSIYSLLCITLSSLTSPITPLHPTLLPVQLPLLDCSMGQGPLLAQLTSSCHWRVGGIEGEEVEVVGEGEEGAEPAVPAPCPAWSSAAAAAHAAPGAS